MHLAIYTRLDLSHTASKLSQFNSDPSIIHFQAAKHVLRYIQGTLDYGILYTSESSENIIILPTDFSDPSFSDDPDDTKSTSGYTFTLANGCISFNSC